MSKSTQWPCRGCGAMLSGRGGKHYCGPDCRPRCSIDGCDKVQHARKLCSAHATRESRYGDALAPRVRQSNFRTPGAPTQKSPCSVEGCGQPSRKRGWCASHYSQWRREGEVRPFRYKWSEPGPCLVCGKLEGTSVSRQFCSAACSRYWYSHDGVLPINPSCVRCGTEIDLSAVGKKGQRRRSTVKMCNRCKAQHRTEATPGQLAKRDGPFCQLCGCDVDLLAVFPDKMRPSVDHTIPRAWGGSDAASNNQLTHLLCNQIKSDRYEGVSSRTSP